MLILNKNINFEFQKQIIELKKARIEFRNTSEAIVVFM